MKERLDLHWCRLPKNADFEAAWQSYQKYVADHPGSLVPIFEPTPEEVERSNISEFGKVLDCESYEQLHQFSIQHPEIFYQKTLERLNIKWRVYPEKIIGNPDDVKAPQWLKGARLNIVESCFQRSRDEVAVVSGNEQGEFEKTSYGELLDYSRRIAQSLISRGVKKGDAVAINMPMHRHAVALYLGTLMVGGVVVSIADSFSADEVAVRLKIANAKVMFVQDNISRAGKKLAHAERFKDILIDQVVLRDGQFNPFGEFLVDGWLKEMQELAVSDPINILFSSGTTGEPKAIVWNSVSALKGAIDAHFHHDVHARDVVCWPTNLGWMMGPWLIFATLLNGGTMALFDGAPTGKLFAEFILQAKVQILGVIPSLVKTWRSQKIFEAVKVKSIKLLSSTGECSNAEDYFYLSHVFGVRPVIEYCGGTEIAGGYITGTIVTPQIPATFSGPALGCQFMILNEDGCSTNQGEVYLQPPMFGSSETLLNKDHNKVYFEDVPKLPSGNVLRRHGDQMESLGWGYFQALGRADDTMNLGGIKTSSAEIERAIIGISGIKETAAVALNPPGGGPSLLVIFATLSVQTENLEQLKQETLLAMQKAIKNQLNPLFKIHQLEIIDAIPRTASNKIMRRVLRDQFQQKYAVKL